MTVDLAREAIRDLRSIYEDAILNAPRSLQETPGPSEIGNACDRCLIHRLAGTPIPPPPRAPWLPTVGTACHEWAEMAMIRHLADTGSNRWLPEARVFVGHLRGEEVWGTCDVFDRETGTVIDLKFTGESTRKKVRADGSGTSVTYQRQVQLYGKGMANAGEKVNAVAVYFIGRNSLSLTVDRLFTAPYDEQVAIDALNRANQFASWIDLFGADAVLAGAGPHTGHEFSCDRMPDAPAAGTHRPPSGLDGLIATA